MLIVHYNKHINRISPSVYSKKTKISNTCQYVGNDDQLETMKTIVTKDIIYTKMYVDINRQLNVNRTYHVI